MLRHREPFPAMSIALLDHLWVFPADIQVEGCRRADAVLPEYVEQTPNPDAHPVGTPTRIEHIRLLVRGSGHERMDDLRRICREMLHIDVQQERNALPVGKAEWIAPCDRDVIVSWGWHAL